MPRSGPRAVRKYSDEFKLTAVRLSQQPGLQVKTVAAPVGGRAATVLTQKMASGRRG